MSAERKTRGHLLDRVATGLGGVVDGAVLSALRYRFSTPTRRAAPSGDGLPLASDRRAMLVEAIAYYQRPEILSGTEFFLAPPLPQVTEVARRSLADGRVVDTAFPSAFVPSWDRVRTDYLQHEPNRTARARLFLHEEPARTTLVCLHGFRGGAYFLEERAFAVRWLYQLGLDVVLFQLPFHGQRAGAHAPIWPSANPVRTNEGFAHAIFDLRALVKWLRGRARAERVAVTGMSLGGYTSALWATLDPLAFVAPIIPVASFPEVMWSHGEGSKERQRAERDGITLEMLREVMAVHTPLLRAPTVPAERVLIVSATGNRIAPIEQAEKLARHFHAEELRFAGGHVLQFGRGDAFRALARRMAALSLVPPRR